MLDKSRLKKKFKELNKQILEIKNIGEGMLGGIHEKYWVDSGNKQFLFKYNKDDKDYSDFGEVFTSFVCFALGVKCVKAIFCEDFFDCNEQKRFGVLIESYRTKNVVESFSLASLVNKYKRRHCGGYIVSEILSICKEFCEDNNLLLDLNLEQELKEMALLDYLLIQSDRHAKNIEFLVEKVDGIKMLKLAPMFDNGFCLYLNNGQRENVGYLEKLLTKKYVEITLNNLNIKPVFFIGETDDAFDEGECITVDLAKELLRNKKLMNIYEQFKKLNINEEIEFVDSMKKESLPSLNKNLILYGIKNRIKLLDLEILKQECSFNENFEDKVENDIFKL